MDRSSPHDSALLTPIQMARADEMTIAAGTSGIDLMIRAGRTVFDRVIAGFPDAETIHVLTSTPISVETPCTVVKSVFVAL